MSEIRWCAVCEAEQGFEAPPCEDGHGTGCPDLACVECGHAIIVGVLLAVGSGGAEAVQAARAA